MADKDGFTFGIWDHVVLVIVFVLTTFIGLYHVWRAKSAVNTHEFLVTGKRAGLLPLVLSTVATSLTPVTLLGLPTEAYSNGAQLYIAQTGWIISKLFAVYAIVPVLYNLKMVTLNQYVECRFKRLLRTVPAFIGLLMNVMLVADDLLNATEFR